MNHRTIGLLMFISVFLIFTSCMHLKAAFGSEDALRQRITMEWEAKVKKDWGTVYDLMVGICKDTIDRNRFIQKANVNVQDFAIKEVRILEYGRKAQAVVDYRIKQMNFGFTVTSREEWLWENGDWHLNLMTAL